MTGEGITSVLRAMAKEINTRRAERAALPAILEDISEDGRYCKEDRRIEFGEQVRDGFRRRSLGQQYHRGAEANREPDRVTKPVGERRT